MIQKLFISYTLLVASISLIAQDTYQHLQYRNVGPTRGGRVTAVAGHAALGGTFFMGATGGGVWKTTNFGHEWNNVSDGYFATPSIGSIAIAPSDPDIVFVGTGSDGIRSNVIIGKGVYRSGDQGDTWQHLGLEKTGQIGAVIVHPNDTNTVYVAALGNPFANNPERGVFKTTDGGSSWEKILFHSDSVGAIDLEFHPSDPNTIYASLWRGERKPWTIISGGHQVGGIYKSVDAGQTWIKLENGLPTGLIGKSDMAVSPARPDVLWALVEAPQGEGGVFRSNNSGESFELVSTKKQLLDRPFYYCNIDANPLNPESIYVNATGYWHSTDGGKNWTRKRTPHGDNHETWISPADTLLHIQCNDGGANISRDGGETWSSIHNQSTAELYQVNLDDQTPYWLYAGQQDNSTIAVPSSPPYRPAGGPTAFWTAVGGCETGPAVPKPGNPNIVYSNCKGRFGTYNKLTGQEQQFYVGASNMYGHNPEELRFRFQRVSPIHVSPHNPDVVYHASQYLHRTTDDGMTWEIISPDLTAFRPEEQVISGSPITRDITGEEFYSTIYSIQESAVQEGVIWVGANDGPIHVTKDNGKTWKDVTPQGLPEGGRVQTVEPSVNDAASAFVAVLRYQLGDFKPYIYSTSDYGANWQLLTPGDNGIPIDHPTRVVRQDPTSPNVLYAGTEFGMFVSHNSGTSWESFQLNLPVTPVTDIKIHDNDLVLSTMGRGFWILDDIQTVGSPLKGLSISAPDQEVMLRYWGSSDGIPSYPSPGLSIDYRLAKDYDNGLSLKIRNDEGEVVKTFMVSKEAKSKREDQVSMATGFRTSFSSSTLLGSKGSHRLRWDFRHDNPSDPKSNLRGPRISPGRYEIELSDSLNNGKILNVQLNSDPRLELAGISDEDLQAQESLALEILAMRNEVREIQERLEKQLEGGENDAARAALDQIKTKEGRYHKPMLAAQLSYLYSMVMRADQRPGRDAYERANELKSQITKLKTKADRP